MPMRHGGSAAMNSSSLARATLGRQSTGLPVASTPCSAKTFFARSIPMVTMAVMEFPFRQTSELMRDRTSPRCACMPYAATVRFTWDVEVHSIR